MYAVAVVCAERGDVPRPKLYMARTLPAAAQWLLHNLLDSGHINGINDDSDDAVRDAIDSLVKDPALSAEKLASFICKHNDSWLGEKWNWEIARVD